MPRAWIKSGRHRHQIEKLITRTMHPLKLTVLLSWLILVLAQISLFVLLDHPIWSIVATIPLLLPIVGMFRDKLYTYKWFGFVTLIYFCIGVSELVANPALRAYALVTLVCSITLLFGSIYYVRYLARHSGQSDEVINSRD